MLAKRFLTGPFRQPFPTLDNRLWQFRYAEMLRGRYRHVISLDVAPGLDNELTLSLLRCMHANQALVGLERGNHYQWGGLSTIGFRSKNVSALFILFATVD